MSAEDEIRWGPAQRFEFIEWRAFWNGRVNRKDLEDRFAISTPQASADFARYLELAPGNIAYDKVEKAYLVNRPDFRPKFSPLAPERYLRQLEAIATGTARVTDTWFDTIPPTDVVPEILRGPEAFNLNAIVDAIRSKRSIGINYLSLTRSGPRDVCPHAFAFDGFRWHMRALCVERGEFRDYVLGRVLSVLPPTVECSAEAADDVEWNTYTTLKLVAHPALNSSQKKAIEHDFRIENGELRVPMRLALAFYFIRRHNLDLREKNFQPERLQLFLQNFDEIEKASQLAKEAGKLNVKRHRQTVA